MLHAWPRWRAANDVTIKTCYYGRPSVVVGRRNRHLCITHIFVFTLTYDVDFQSSASYMLMTHTHAKKIKIKRQFGQQIEWKQTDGQTDKTNRTTFPANAVGNRVIVTGVYGVDTETGCGNAVLRIYSNKSTLPTYELCGIRPTNNKEIVTAGNSVRFKYSLLIFTARCYASAIYAI